MQSWQSNDLVTQIVLTIFRINTDLLEKGNELVYPLGMTSACWRILGAIALSNKAPSCSEIIEYMGITRQGAQKQLNIAKKKGLIISISNPNHKKVPLYELTKHGRDIYEKAMKAQKNWLTPFAKNSINLNKTLDVLDKFELYLKSNKVPVAS